MSKTAVSSGSWSEGTEVTKTSDGDIRDRDRERSPDFVSMNSGRQRVVHRGEEECAPADPLRILRPSKETSTIHRIHR
jgi:hypothetical protein